MIIVITGGEAPKTYRMMIEEEEEEEEESERAMIYAVGVDVALTPLQPGTSIHSS